MTVAALPSVAEYMEDGVTTSFPAPFRFKAAADLVVERILDSGLITLAIGVDYTVSGGETDAGGAVKRTAVTNGGRLRIRRETSRAQPMVYTTGDRFPAVSHEEALDRQMLIAQEQAADLGDLDNRALTVPPGEVAPALAPLSARIGGTKKVLAVDQDTGAIQVEPIGGAYKGDTGPANSTYTSLADLKNAPITNGTYSLLTVGGRAEYAYVDGNFTGIADDALVVKLNKLPITVGALIATGSITPAMFGASVGIADNAPAFGRMLAVCRYLAVNYAIPPRITFLSGFYRYSGLDGSGTALNWAVQGLHIDAQPGVVLIHTGAGRAFNVDGGATGGGVAMMKVTGGLVVRGNANTTDGIYQRAIHHSSFDMEVQNVSNYALLTEWVVCNEYWFRCSPLFRPAFAPVPVGGMFLSRRGTGEATSRCNFYNPILEGINGYGININDGIVNTFHGGTSESNAGGIFLGAGAVSNVIDGLDLEFNTTSDVFCQGYYNKFRGLLSDSASVFGGFFNSVEDGLWNNILINGVRNNLEILSFSTAGGAFTDNGDGTSWEDIRNATTQQFLVDRKRQPVDARYLTDTTTGLLEASATIVNGGSAADTYGYKYGTGKRTFGGPGGDRFSHSSAGTSFNGVAPISRRGLPVAATDAATTQALANALRQYLVDHGQCS